MITIDDPDLEAMLRVIEQETGEAPAAVLRRAMARAFDGTSEDPARGRPTPGLAADAPLAEPGQTTVGATGAKPRSVWALMAEMAGSVDMPPDWSEEHDHYIHGVPKRNAQA